MTATLQSPPTSRHTRQRRPAHELMTAMGLIQAPRGTRLFARLLVVTFLLSPFLLIWVPWQQSIHASGRVIAFDPTQRQQEVEAPVDGRILRWHVVEGQEVRGPEYDNTGKLVRPGTPLVSIQDPDPDLPRRLAQQQQAVEDRRKAARERIDSFTTQVQALERSREQALLAATNRLEMARERLKAANEAVTVAALQRDLAAQDFRMETQQIQEGLTSQIAYLRSKQRRDQTEADERRATNSRDAAKNEVAALTADLEKVRNDADAAISSARAAKQSAEAELASATRDLQEIEMRIARQSTQEVTAPCDGTVYRILANASSGGSTVKFGDRLLIITPRIKQTNERMVELFVDGNDEPQLAELWRQRQREGIEEGVPVRLQFEGWPAIQVIGWPSLAWGTFAGRVVFIDPHDDGKGRFRILVRPDPDEEPWPDDFTLRQGGRAQGWVLLNRVSLGYELWRRFNGFPPVVVDKDAESTSKKKPQKAKVPK